MRASLLNLRSLEAGRVISLFAVLLEVLWAYPWVVWISKWETIGWARPPLTLAGAAVLVAVTEAVSRFALARDWSPRRVRLVVLSAVAILLAVVVRLDLSGGHALWDPGWGQYVQEHLPLLISALAFGGYLLWRGICVGRETLTLDVLYRKFLIGLTALVVLLVLWSAASRGDEFPELSPSVGIYVLAYFFVGLLGLAFANLQSIRQEMLRREGAPGLSYRRWLPLLLGVVVAIAAVSLGMASALSFDLLALALHGLGVLANWLLIAFVYAVALPLGVVAAGLIYLFQWLVSVLGRGEPPQPFSPPAFSDLTRSAEEQQGAGGIPPEVVLALKWGLVALLAILVLFVLARALSSRRKSREEEDVEEVTESLWSWEGFKKDLRSFLATLLRWFRRKRPARPVVVFPPIAAAHGEDQARLFTVREMYQGLLWEGRRAGLPRRQPETPYEYQAKLESRVASGAAELQAITEAYVADRYGDVAIARDQLGPLNRLWRYLRSVLRGEGSGTGQEHDAAQGS